MVVVAVVAEVVGMVSEPQNPKAPVKLRILT